MPTPVSWPPIAGTAYFVPSAGEFNWANLSAYLVALQNAQSTTTQKVAFREAVTTPVSIVSATDCVVVIKMTVPSPVAVTLPVGIQGQWFNISDGTGDAATNNITITPQPGDTVNGDPVFVISSNDDAITFIYDSLSQNWKVITQILSFTIGSVARSSIQAGNPDWVVINAPITGLLSEEQFLSPVRGGMGANGSGFTGLVKAAAGVFSASTLVNADVAAGANIDASKLGTGIVDNTEFNRLNEIGLLYSTTKVTGGVASINGGNPALFDVSAGTAKQVNYSGTPATPAITDVVIAGFTAQVLTNLATADITYLSITPGGALVQQTSFPTPSQQRDNVFLSRINHTNRVNISFIDNIGNNAQSIGNQWADLVDALGSFNISGNTLSANGANLSFNKTVGAMFSRYFNQVATPTNPHNVTTAATAPTTFQYRTQNAAPGGNVTLIDPTMYDVAGVVTAVPGGGATSTIQRVFLFPSNNVRVQYGQNIYASLAAAVASIPTDTFIINPTNAGFAILIGYIVVQKNCVALNAATAAIVPAARFDSGAGGGSTAAGTFQSVYANSTQPQITLAAAQGGLQIRDAAAPLGTNLLEVQSNTGATTFFSVTVAGIAGSNFPTANRVMVTDASSKIGQSGVTTTEVGFLSGTVGVTGTVNLVRSTSPTITTPIFITNATVPLVLGGNAVGSILTLQSTSAAGTTDQILFRTGNNGSIDAGSIATGGGWAINPVVVGNKNGQRNTINGAFYGGGVTGTDSSGWIKIGVNSYTGALNAEAGRTNATTSGASIVLQNRTGAASAVFRLEVNSITDTTTTLPISALTCDGNGSVTVGTTTAIGSSTYVGNPIVGKTDGAASTTGMVGENLQNRVSALTNIPATGLYGDAGTLSLTPGVWMISFFIEVRATGATVTSISTGVGTATGNSASGLVAGLNSRNDAINIPTATNDASYVIPPFVVRITTTTSYFGKIKGAYSVATPQILSTLTAIRIA